MKTINYEPYIVDGLLVSLRKLFKEELGYRENTIEVERYVSTQPCGLLVSSGARILQGEHRASPLPWRIRKPAC